MDEAIRHHGPSTLVPPNQPPDFPTVRTFDRSHPQLLFLDSRLATAPLLAIVLFFLVKRHAPQKIRSSTILHRLIRPYITFLTIQEAEARLYRNPQPNASNSVYSASNKRKRSWRTVALGILALFEALGWCSVAIYTLSTLPRIDPYNLFVNYWWNSVVMFVAWAYCAYRPLRRPKSTPLYDCLTIYVVASILAILRLLRYIYSSYVLDTPLFGDPLLAVGTLLNLVVIGCLLAITFTTHMANPGPLTGSTRVKGDDIVDGEGNRISSEDYTTLWNWISFAWLTPVTQQQDMTKKEDVWNLSPPMSTEAVYFKYTEMGRKFYIDGKITPSRFFWHWWGANSLDVISEFLLSTAVAILDFAGPLSLKLILDSLSEITMPDPEHPLTRIEVRQLRAQAIVYSLLYLVASITRSSFLLYHLWFGRRAATRTRIELMMWIYDKALKRREVLAPPATAASAKGQENAKTEMASKNNSGIATQKASDSSTSISSTLLKSSKTKEEREEKEKAEQEKEDEQKKKVAAADLGKVVNLMSTDVPGLEWVILWAPFLYNPPLQIVISLIFLYKLMGPSAYAGAIIFVFIAPITYSLSFKSAKIFEKMQMVRDKKMSVLNEMISEVRFIKFLAYEDQWIQRALDARSKELKVILQSGLLGIVLNTIWRLAPVAVSIVSFWVYVWSGHRLTVSTAFAVIQIFNSLGSALGVLPMVFVQFVKSKISIGRITAFLDEPEVDDELSPFKNGSDNIRRGTDVTFVDVDIMGASIAGATKPKADDKVKADTIGISNGNFLWSEPAPTPPPKTDEKIVRQPWYRRKFWIQHPPVVRVPPPATVTQSLPDADTTMTSDPLVDEPQVVDTADRDGSSRMSIGGVIEPANTDMQFKLRDINAFFPSGKLSVVTGPTASGKTALLRALLGEMYAVSSANENASSTSNLSTQIYLPKRPWILDPSTGLRDYTSYAAQTPWLEHLSIKDNILFGSVYDEERYQAVLECCALEPDLEMFEDGDRTEIGERGVSLSGGQKARVALARAVYAPTKYVLLDDPLSAVDSHTGRFLLDHLFTGPLLANRTVILVTHHVDLILPAAGYLVRMLNGRIDTQGTINDLRQQGLLEEITTEAKKEATAEDIKLDSRKEDGNASNGKEKDNKSDNNKKEVRKLVQEEKIAEGRVKLSVYHSYIKASAYITWIAVLILKYFGIGMQIATRFWMQKWGEAYVVDTHLDLNGSITTFYLRDSQKTTKTASAFHLNKTIPIHYLTLPSASEYPMFYVAVYAILGFLAVIGESLGTAALVLGAYRASKKLFKRLLYGVTRATMRWHDTTPTGRILNRFSKDFETIDTKIAPSFSITLQHIASVTLSVLTIVVISPFFLIPGSIIAYFYVHLAKIYLRTTRPLKRLESTTISPIFASFRTTLEGLATIRAFSAERRFLDTMIKNLDTNTKCYWTYWLTNLWGVIRFDWLGGFVVTSVMLLVTAFSGDINDIKALGGGDVFWRSLDMIREQASGGSAGFEGLAIATAMGFTASVYWAVRFISQLELDLNSVERIDQYLELPQEPPAIVESNRPPAYWPSTTSPSSANNFILVENLVVKYAPDLPAVLHGVSFRIKAGERVGLVGRTGSGKSTLATALLRFVDPTEGRIVLDGIDITKIGLYDLRSRVTFIAQDSVLFSGTIRHNLDPFDEHTDEACLDALRRVQLVEQSPAATRPTSILNEPISTIVATSPGAPSSSATSITQQDTEGNRKITLDTLVNSGGSNFSHGQRQLIALARALLRKTSIIVMDEATSSIDFETDTKIQIVIREEFKSSCVVTVAHRLQTILEYDRILVMDAGKLVENGPPRELMKNQDGVFFSMCAKAGIIRDN